ncbi:MAG: response regulator [Anaerolineae bacterium]|nr:response regulator [Anaerolineae bacterium]MDQ7036482.1 response regulator [Anaerolineae bacterium]
MSDVRKPLILVIDDDPALQTLIVSLLRRGDMEAISAMDGSQAREALDQDRLPDLVLLDLMLPEISGIDLLKEFRSQPKLEQLPVIILSALADPEQIREGLDEGADRYLTKPYLANNLIKTVREVLEQGRRT